MIDELERLYRHHWPAPAPVQIVYPHSRLLAAKVRAFVDFATPRLRERLQAFEGVCIGRKGGGVDDGSGVTLLETRETMRPPDRQLQSRVLVLHGNNLQREGEFDAALKSLSKAEGIAASFAHDPDGLPKPPTE